MVSKTVYNEKTSKTMPLQITTSGARISAITEEILRNNLHRKTLKISNKLKCSIFQKFELKHAAV